MESLDLRNTNDALRGRVDPEFWVGKRVLITGHTGFKGSWLSLWLAQLGASITGVALIPESSPNLFESAKVSNVLKASHTLDIRESEKLVSLIREAQPEIVLHLAAQSMVRISYLKPVETFDINTLGTVKVLEALRNLDSVRVAVMVTSDKVYANNEWEWPYRENDTLGGFDPYSASKAACEIVIDSYRKSFMEAKGVFVTSARAGNVIGGGDWSSDRLFPDAIRAWRQGSVLEVRRPNAIRPWQHVLEPLSSYLVLVQHLWSGSAEPSAYNFGPDSHEAATVEHVVSLAAEAWGEGVKFDLGDGTKGPHEARLLSLETARARKMLAIAPRWGLKECIQHTIKWYKNHLAGADAHALCSADIEAFEATI